MNQQQIIDFVVFGDIHFGEGYLYGKFDKETGLNSALVDKKESVEQIIDFCKSNTVKTCVITGDINKEGNGSADQVRRKIFSELIKELSKHVEDLYLIVGNHDIYGETNIYSDIKTWAPDNIHVCEEAQYIEKINAVILPYFNLKSVYNHDKSKEFNNLFISEAMEEVVKMQYAKVPEDKRDSVKCFFHFTLSEAEYREGVLTKWGHDIIISSSLLDNLFQVSVGGHLHEPQKIGKSCYYHGGITHSEINQARRSFITIADGEVSRVSLNHRKIVSLNEDTIEEALDNLEGIYNTKSDAVVVNMSKGKSEYDISLIAELEDKLSLYHRSFLKYAFAKKVITTEDFANYDSNGKTDTEIILDFVEDKEKKDKIKALVDKHQLFNRKNE